MRISFSFINRQKELSNAVIDDKMTNAEIARSLREAVTVSCFPQAGENASDAKALALQLKEAYGYAGDVNPAGKTDGFYCNRTLPVVSPVSRILAAAKA